MEYTKDLILNVHYSEEPTRFCFKTKNRTSRFWQKLKKHKIITSSIMIGCTLMLIDGILVMNFIQVLEML